MSMKKSRNDPYWEVVVEQYDNLLSLYQQFAAKRPVMLFDIQERQGGAYPCRDFAAELSEKSQQSLARQYKAARKDGHMVVFIRDNVERQLVSYSVPIEKNRTRHANRRAKT